MNHGVTAAAKVRRKRMSSSIPETFRAAVLTVSDSCARGERNDLSGPAVSRVLQEHHFSVVETRIVADDHGAIQKAIVELARKARLVVTTGGTGISARDVTPEATRTVCGRMLEGVAERMRREGEKKRSEERRVGKECRSRWSPYH